MSEVSTPIETNLLPAAASSLSSQFREAYNSVADELTAIPAHELIPINLDVPKTVINVLGALPEIRTQRTAAQSLPGFDLGRFDILERAALAAAFANARYVAAAAPRQSLPELGALGAGERSVLLSDAAALVKRGLLDPSLVREFKNENGYRNIAF